jgi:hypothetical protein
LKKWLSGKRFVSSEEVESLFKGCFEELDVSHFKHGIEAIDLIFFFN